MLKPSVVLSAYKKKGEAQKRKISYRDTYMKWIVLTLGVFVVFGSLYCFDGPSALQSEIQYNLSHKNESKKMSQFTFNLLYALYAFPNTVIPLIGGIAIDKFGARVLLVITAFICVIGQTIFAVGGYSNIFWVMIIGRIVFGIGGQTLMAAQNTLLSNWFKPNQLSLVLGICISFPKLGSSLNSYINPKLGTIFRNQNDNDYKNVYIPLLIGVGVMIISWLLSLALAYLDYKSDEQEKRNYQSLLLLKPSKVSKPSPTRPKKESIINPKDKDAIKQKQTKYGEVKIQETQQNIANVLETGQVGQHISLKNITQLSLTFWLLIMVSMLAQALFIPFLDNGNLYFSKIYNITPETAGNFLIIPYLFCAIISPPFGILIDKIGKRGYVILFSCFMFALTYAVMIFLESQDFNGQTNQIYIIILPLSLLGICTALFCTAIVPSVPMIVQAKLFGTAFGIMQMLQNLALATFPLIAGIIRDHFSKGEDGQRKGFQKQTQFYFLISLVCFVLSLVLLITDKYSGNKFNPKDFRKEYVKTVLEKEEQNF